jgi:uncharacterized membrane protein (DUF485 family)
MSEQQHGVWEATQSSSNFQKLKKSYRGFAFPLTLAFLVWYFLYVILTAFAREWISTPVIGNINIALILGVLQFVSTFVIAWLYERHSSSKLDAPSEAIKHEVEKELAK